MRKKEEPVSPKVGHTPPEIAFSTARYGVARKWIIWETAHIESPQASAARNKRERELFHVDQLDGCASTALAEHIESQGAPAAHDTGRYLRFIELRQPRTQEN